MWKQVVSKTGSFDSTHLSVEVVWQAAEELALDGVLLCEQGQVVAEFVVGGDDGAFAILVKLGAAGAAEDLHDIQYAQIHQSSSLGVVYLSSLFRDSKRLQSQRGTRGLFQSFQLKYVISNVLYYWYSRPTHTKTKQHHVLIYKCEN